MNEDLVARAEPVRVLVVARRTLDLEALRLNELDGVDVVDSSNDPSEIMERLETLQPDVLLFDLMFPSDRSIEIIQQVSDERFDVPVLGLVPDPPPYEQVVLAARAGARGFVTTSDEPDELSAAIRQVKSGKKWLPAEQTYEVLQDVSRELAVTSADRRGRLGAIILGLLPLGAALAAFLAYIWREYWGSIGVRPVDLGIDPSTRVADAVIAILFLFGVFGPLLFVGGTLTALGGWLDKRPDARGALVKAQSFRPLRVPIGRILFSRTVAWLLLAALVLVVIGVIAEVAPLIVVMFIGPAVGVILLARALDLDDALPEFLRLPAPKRSRLIAIASLALVTFVTVLSIDALVVGPDLREDGVHGILASRVLGFKAQPVIVTDVDGNREPFGALYLGGNADLYVLYDPCDDGVEFVSVGSSRIDIIDEVDCP